MPKADNPEFSTVTIRSGFVEFNTMEGERITAALAGQGRDPIQPVAG
jgi:hypothetical protein